MISPLVFIPKKKKDWYDNQLSEIKLDSKYQKN